MTTKTKIKEQPTTKRNWVKANEDKLSTQIRIGLTEEDSDKLDALCEEHCVSAHELIRMLVRKEYKALTQ